MRRKIKKSTSVLLTLALVLGLVFSAAPPAAVAADPDSDHDIINIGDLFTRDITEFDGWTYDLSSNTITITISTVYDVITVVGEYMHDEKLTFKIPDDKMVTWKADCTGDPGAGNALLSIEHGKFDMTGNIVSDAGGIDATNASVTVNGSITANSGYGVVADDATVIVIDGDIDADNNSINAFSGASVTVIGDINSRSNDGILALASTNVNVTGNITANKSGVDAYDSATVIVNGNIKADDYGVKADDATVTVTGNITSDTGVSADNDAKVTVNGTITATTDYIIVDGAYKSINDITEPTTKPDYFTYTDGTSTVWVIDLDIAKAQVNYDNDIDWDRIRGSNEAQNLSPYKVTSNLALPVLGAVYSSIITWKSNNTDVVSITGVVTRPAYGNPDAPVTLTATITHATVSAVYETTIFDLTVLAATQGGTGPSGGGGGGAVAQPANSFLDEISTFVQGSIDGLVLIIEKDLSLLLDVKVDGNTIIKDQDYTATSGSTVITLLPEYLETLSVGSHSLAVSFKDNANVSTKFTVAAEKEPGTEPEPGITPPPGPSGPFTDVEIDDWYYSPIMFVYEKGLMVGIATDKFGPNVSMTRGMAVTILYREAGSPSVSGLSNPFNDVPDYEYFADGVKWAAENDIVAGYGDGRFGPNDYITREQLAAVLHRYQEFSGKIPPNTLPDKEYADQYRISDYSLNAVSALTMQGVMGGKPGNIFDPRSSATRAEFASMLQRFLGAL